MELDVTAEVKKAIGTRELSCVTAALGKLIGRKAQTVSVRFVSLKEIQRLNRQYRGKNRATDVLSFESELNGDSVQLTAFRKAMSKARESVQLGDVVICPAFARVEAKRRAIPLREELLRLVVHGVMHLAGWDHEDPDDEAKMFRVQEEVVEKCQTL